MNMALIDSIMSRNTLLLNLVPLHFSLDLRWTQAIVTAVSHFLVQNSVRILRTGQQTSTRGTPGRLETCLAEKHVKKEVDYMPDLVRHHCYSISQSTKTPQL